MAVFSKFFKAVQKDRKRPACSHHSPENLGHVLGLRVKAKLLLPVVDLPETSPAINLFNAINWNKRKGKPLVTLTLSPECLILSNNHKWALTPRGGTELKLNYQDILSMDVKSKSEVAITSKKSENHFWCICLKLMAVKGKSRFSRNRRITANNLHEFIDTLQCTTTSTLCIHDESMSKEPLASIPVSDSFTYIDFGATDHPQETVDDSALLISNKVHFIVSRSVSCPILTIMSPEQTDDRSQLDNQPDKVNEDEHDEKVDYGELLAKHSECCINPCGVSCPMYPVETSGDVSNKHEQTEITSTHNTTDCHCSSNAQQLPSTSFAYYWDSTTGQYHIQPTAQPSSCPVAGHSPAFPYTNGEPLTSQLPQNTSNAHQLYGYGQANEKDYYAAYYAYLYQLYYASYYSRANLESEMASSSDVNLPLPMSDRRRRRLLREMKKVYEQAMATSQHAYHNCQPTYYYGASSHQARTFQPAVQQSDSQSDHSPAFPLVNGQYETSPHILYPYQHPSYEPRKYPIDIQAIESDAEFEYDASAQLLDTCQCSSQDPEYTLDMEALLKDFL